MGTWTTLVQWKGPPKKLRNDPTPDVILCLYAGKNKCRIKGREHKTIVRALCRRKAMFKMASVDREWEHLQFSKLETYETLQLALSSDSGDGKVGPEIERRQLLTISLFFFVTFRLDASNQILFKLIPVMNEKSFHSHRQIDWSLQIKVFQFEKLSATATDRNWSSSRNGNGSLHRNIC